MRQNSDHIPSKIHFGQKVPAIYRDVEEPTYQCNRLIEALPRQLSTEECIQRMTLLPVYSPHERSEPALYRINAVGRLSKFRIPLPDNFIIYQKFSRLLREGYFGRNPSNSDWVRQLNTGFPGLLTKIDAGDYGWTPQFNTSGLCFGIFGASGIGKTSLVENILHMYPQVIVHSRYKGKPFDLQQIVWLKLDCPVKGSARNLCLDFAYAFDALTGSGVSYYDKFKSVSADTMLSLMAKMAAAVSLGALVVDEIHRLCQAHSGGEKALLNFFVKLANTLKIPVILIGTFKSLQLFSKDFSLARRIAGQGDHLMSHKQKGDEWDFFLDELWRYQFTNVETPLTEKIKNTLYEESQGILDIAVKIYMMSQWSVIGTSSESITPELITRTASANFNAARPMLQALRTSDYEKLATIEDLIPQTAEIDTFLKNSVARVTITGSSATLGNLQQTSDKPGESPWEIDPISEIFSRLVAVGIDATIARDCANAAFQRFEKSTDIILATKEALHLASELSSSEAGTKDELSSTTKASPNPLPTHYGDLRVIAGIAKKQADVTIDMLRADGAIRSPLDYLG